MPARGQDVGSARAAPQHFEIPLAENRLEGEYLLLGGRLQRGVFPLVQGDEVDLAVPSRGDALELARGLGRAGAILDQDVLEGQLLAGQGDVLVGGGGLVLLPLAC